jgi:hypothetical protein
MASLRKLQENWDGFARTDSLWAICVDPGKRNHKSNEQEFNGNLRFLEQEPQHGYVSKQYCVVKMK